MRAIACLVLFACGCGSNGSDPSSNPDTASEPTCSVDIGLAGGIDIDAAHEYPCGGYAWQTHEDAIRVTAKLPERDGVVTVKLFGLQGSTAPAELPADMNVQILPSVWEAQVDDGSGCTATLEEHAEHEYFSVVTASVACIAPLVDDTAAPLTLLRLRLRTLYGRGKD